MCKKGKNAAQTLQITVFDLRINENSFSKTRSLTNGFSFISANY